ncbi:uncharacterized protein BT62DRAFT_1011884 [Guyanagaster necrorhizus]|uniref:Uncharacterized protein n=1 Tax=Guyanagaster necrorhizus TaxID=856835 RepID=A0A9P7VI16_9AGAR|nr:uncharacterized protein BT62DRAFT_1011884 [Guyanagaster necrorhizus MCA 3950]KAG7441084.1 hypothetical protein BT62DRAFT_1011884 [Guyanagaster necrorhizus MCA 3950]
MASIDRYELLKLFPLCLNQVLLVRNSEWHDSTSDVVNLVLKHFAFEGDDIFVQPIKAPPFKEEGTIQLQGVLNLPSPYVFTIPYRSRNNVVVFLLRKGTPCRMDLRFRTGLETIALEGNAWEKLANPTVAQGTTAFPLEAGRPATARHASQRWGTTYPRPSGTGGKNNGGTKKDVKASLEEATGKTSSGSYVDLLEAETSAEHTRLASTGPLALLPTIVTPARRVLERLHESKSRGTFAFRRN